MWKKNHTYLRLVNNTVSPINVVYMYKIFILWLFWNVLIKYL